MRKLFGTDGIRGVANEHPMTIETCLKLVDAVVEKFCTSQRKVVIGRDTRISGPVFEQALFGRFCSLGVDVILLGVVPTPAVSILTPHLGADLGIMISASHNPYGDNGIKLFDSRGLKLKDSQEIELETLMSNLSGGRYLEVGENDAPGGSSTEASVVDFYYDRVKSSFEFEKSRAGGLKIVVDSSNGSFSRMAPRMFREFGFDVVSIFDSPNGTNINHECGVTNPQAIVSSVLENSADIGISFDGDGDRLLLCDENGKIMDGDHILAILAQSENLENTKIVATVMSNFGLEQHLKKRQIQLVRTNVGDRYISEYMQRSEAKFGGEPSGHIIIKDHALTGDGLFAVLKVVEYMVKSGKAASDMWKIFTPYPSFGKNIMVSDKSIVSMREFSDMVKKFEKQLEGRGKLIVRPSGTEPVIRLFAEGENISELHDIINSLSDEIGKI